MNQSIKKRFVEQDGAALVTVILVSLLLGTACVALLTAVSASSRNNTDALSEYKAYYAAESGLQAAVNVFRYRVEGDLSGVTYSEAAANSTMSNWLGNGPIGVGSESSYALQVTDPDDSGGPTTFSTQGTFEQATAGIYATTRVYGTAPDTLTVSFNPTASTTLAAESITSFGSISVVKAGTGPTSLPSALKFRIDYVMTAPREGIRTIRGTIATNGVVTFQTDNVGQQPSYPLMGGTLKICDSSSSCTAAPTNITVPAATTTPQNSLPVYGKMSVLEPYRLKVVATGYYSPDGPSGAKQSKKVLEAIIQRNFFNDLNSTGAISMIGPNAYFRVGTSSRMDIDGGAYPSVTVSDQAGLNTVNGNHTNGTMLPPPEIQSNDVPEWQQSASAMDALIQQLRQTAQNSGRYFNGTNPSSFGNFSNGTGITFCEGSCSMGGNSSGGGILVVTGTFTTSGNPTFNGLVLAVGRYVSPTNPGGVVRSGGGNEVFTGNIVIAPYDPLNLNAGFEQPRYDQSGGPGDTINSDVALDQAFDGTSSITDFILGVAEK
jgi:hypothetical protein